MTYIAVNAHNGADNRWHQIEGQIVGLGNSVVSVHSRSTATVWRSITLIGGEIYFGGSLSRILTPQKLSFLTATELQALSQEHYTMITVFGLVRQ